jgi:hypothetical protein
VGVLSRRNDPRFSDVEVSFRASGRQVKNLSNRCLRRTVLCKVSRALDIDRDHNGRCSVSQSVIYERFDDWGSRIEDVVKVRSGYESNPVPFPAK